MSNENDDRIKNLPFEYYASIALAKEKMKRTEIEVEKAQANQNYQTMVYKYTVLTVFKKLNLPDDATLGDDGSIIYADVPLTAEPENETK